MIITTTDEIISSEFSVYTATDGWMDGTDGRTEKTDGRNGRTERMDGRNGRKERTEGTDGRNGRNQLKAST